jgi:diaminopimelate decarboxylase
MSNKSVPHSLRFPVIDDCVHIGGIPVTRLAQRVGRTPFYVYDRAVVKERIANMRAALPTEVGLFYSVKANPMPAMVQHLCGLVDGFDVASAGEMKVALDTPMPANQITFTGPGKTDAQIESAIAAGVVLNIESAGELQRIIRIADRVGIAPGITIRVNPDFELKRSGMKMAGGSKQFGIDAENVATVFESARAAGVDVHGMHVFAGSQSLNAESIAEAQTKTVALALRLMDDLGWQMRSLNLGGGFGIPYFSGEVALDFGPVARNLHQLVERVAAATPDLRLIIESGRYLVGEAGVYVSRVVDKKVSRGHTYLVTDGGMHHHLAASGNLGQVIRKHYPVAIGNRMSAIEHETVSVVGPLCTPLDMLADSVALPKAELDDLILIFQSGAYGLTASPTLFLGHPAPDEILV